ncbi:hypothetical protein KPH14_004220 [Odynerus spinipes]|uniref:RRM domain-containing protein n=1 Tax=Odynerus spinipes TaxID=1348599 RepID=A0AAD9RY93_9HYME|nr:hypothetical protein KPH14_004220 [Odynerus spinipes]
MTKVKQATKVASFSPTTHLKAVKNNPIQKKKSNKFVATPTGKKQEKEVIKDSPDSPDSNCSSPRSNDKKSSPKQTLNVSKTLNSPNAQSGKGKKRPIREMIENADESDESFEDINEGVVLPEDSFVSHDDDDDEDDDDEEEEEEESDIDLPNILGQSLADDTDEDDSDFDEEEDDEDADDHDSDENEDSQLKGVKMFKGLLKQKFDSIAKNKKKNDDDDDDEDEDDDDDEEDDDDDNDDSIDGSNHETDTSFSPSQTKNKKYNVSIEDDEEEDDEDNIEDEDEEEEEDDEEDESTPGLKDLLGNSIVDDENDEDFEGEDEDDEDIDISDEESEADVDESEVNRRTVFIGNVPKDTKKEEIKKVFKEFGPIQSIRIRGVAPETMGMSKKVAAIKRKLHPNVDYFCMLVVFKNEESASKSLSINGKKFKGNYLRVDTVENKNKTPDNKKAVFLGNLPFKINYNNIWEHFEQCGEIDFVRLIKDKETHVGKGIGYVNFKNEDSVPLALELNGSTLLNREIRVKRCVEKGSDSKSKKKLRNRNNRSLSTESGVKKLPKKIKLNDEVKTTSTVDGEKKLNAKGKLQDSNSSSEKKKTTFQGQKAVVGKKAKKSKLDKKKKKLAAILTAKPKRVQKV